MFFHDTQLQYNFMSNLRDESDLRDESNLRDESKPPTEGRQINGAATKAKKK